MSEIFKESTKVELDLVLNTVVEGILIINADDVIIYCNEPGAKLRNTKVENLLGKPVSDCHSADFYESVKKIIDDIRGGKKPDHKRLVNVGSKYFEITYSKLNGPKDEYLGIVAVSRDVTERVLLEMDLREKTDRLEKLLVTDDLTGLFNKRYFFEKIEEEMKRSKRSGNSFCLLFFDIDNFKTINDLRGHLIGDKILKTIGEIVNNNIRKYLDYGFRYGGDEFLIILSDADQSQAITVAERIRILVKKISFEKVSISLGLVESRKDYLPKTLINYADIAMYKAKSDGGDTISVYVD